MQSEIFKQISKRVFTVIMLMISIIALTLSVASCALTSDESSDPSRETEFYEAVEEDGELELTPTVITPRLRFTTMAASAEDELMPTAAGDTKTLTATTTPTALTNSDLTWTVRWNGSNSATVTNYVTVTPTGTSSATVKLVRAFSTQIVIRVALKSDTTVYAECTADYAKRITSLNVYYNGRLEAAGELYLSDLYSATTNITTTGTAVMGTGTVNDNVKISYNMYVNEEWVSQIFMYTYYYAGLYWIEGGYTNTTGTWSGDAIDLLYDLNFENYSNYDDMEAMDNFWQMLEEEIQPSEPHFFSSTPLFYVDITAKGTYSSYTTTYPIYLNLS